MQNNRVSPSVYCPIRCLESISYAKALAKKNGEKKRERKKEEHTAHSGVKKAHDWMVDQVADFFRTTHKVKTQQVVKSRGQHCGDIELAAYLANETDPVSLVLDLRIAHDRVGSSTDPTLNGHLKYPNNLDQSLNDAAADKIRKYRADYNNRPPSQVSFMSDIASTG